MSKITVWRVLGKGLVFLVINVCNHREHYETPCINYRFIIKYNIYTFYGQQF